MNGNFWLLLTPFSVTRFTRQRIRDAYTSHPVSSAFVCIFYYNKRITFRLLSSMLCFQKSPRHIYFSVFPVIPDIQTDLPARHPFSLQNKDSGLLQNNIW